MEDTQKLSYLDLQGCFGDICDLSQCTYLRNGVGVNKTGEDVESVLHLMLTERWGYDDISEEEADEEDDSVQNSEAETRVIERKRNHHSQDLVDQNGGRADSTEDETDYEKEPTKILEDARSECLNVSMSQESTTVLYRDSPTANPEMIQYYLEHITKGGSIRLKSVDEGKVDIVL